MEKYDGGIRWIKDEKGQLIKTNERALLEKLSKEELIDIIIEYQADNYNQ